MKIFKTHGKLASLALLALTVAMTGGCADSKKKSATTQTQLEEPKAWYGGYFPSQDRPAPRVEPVRAAEPAPAPAPTGNCANYRPAVGADHSIAELSFPTGDKRTSAVMLQQVMPKQVRAGANYDMEIHVTNITNSTLQNVVVNGESIENMSINSSTPAAGRGASGNAQWVIGDLGPCKTQVIRVNAKADRVGTASNCLSVSYNNVLCSALQVVQPAIQIAKTMTPAEGMVCDTYTATIEVKNTGSGPAESVVIKDNLPAGMTTADGKTSVELPVGTLAAGQTATRTLQLKATKSGRFENNATASAAGGLTASSNTVAVVAKQPSLAVSVKCPTTVFLGRPMTYEVTVQNKGDGACNGTTLAANLPAGSSFVSATDGGTSAGTNVNWNLGAIAPGATKTVKMTATSNVAGAYRISATANCACATAVTAECSTDLKGIPAILVECVDDNDPLEVGGETTYTIIVTNQGSAPGTGIRLTIELPGQLDLVSTGGATAGSAAGKTVTFAPLPSLAPKATATWTVRAKANAAGDVRFSIKVTSDQFSNPIIETESTNLYQ